MDIYRFVTRWWCAFALLASLSLLAAAHAFEVYGGLAPCALCLKQREVLWAAAGLSAMGAAWALISRARGTPRITAFLLFAIFATSAIVAGYHAGGELKWWDLPATCSGGGGQVDLSQLSAFLDGTARARPPMCDVVAWSWLGISMAGWNALISVVLAVISLIASRRPEDARAPRS